MTECRTPEMQDLLPDYVSASLDATAAALVDQHLSICDPCRRDIDVLRLARAVRPKTVTVNVAAIVAALLHPAPTLRLVHSARDLTPVASAGDALPRARRRWSASVWQVAAAVGVMMVGGTALLVSRNSPRSLTGAHSSDAQLFEAAESALARTSVPGRVADSVTRLKSAGGETRVSVSYGDLEDYSEAELQRMLDRLELWDGTSSAEPMPTLPVVPTSGGSTP